jgi:hypothetical protein
MDRDWRKLTDYLIAQGIDAIEHTDKTYLAHLVAVYRDLEKWGCDEDVCRGGMFHSIYGTELFQGFKLGLEKRAEVRALIGERAERLGYLNCAMDRGSFDAAVERGTPPYVIRDRITGEDVEVTPADFDDLCRIHLCDWLEQVGRAKMWDYRRAGYRNLAERLGGVGRAAYEEVFAAAPA